MDILLVRHAAPVTTATRPPHEWPLSPAGRAAAAALRPALPGDALWVSSTERKAGETLRHAAGPGVEIVEDARFREVERPGEPFDDDVLDRRRAWMEGHLDQRHDGWELPSDAAERFQRGVSRYDGDRPLVIGTHGLVLTSWLVAVGAVGGGRAAGDFWASLALPDVISLSRTQCTVRVRC